ncbi:MAG: hypothetical protein WDN01_02415 [Rhizomicrobium sp.]
MRRGANLWDRRDVLAAGGAIAGLAVVAAEAGPVPSSGIAVADRRFAASRAFAATAARGGRYVAWIEGDVTNAYNELDLLWRREKIAVSGLTAYGAFFCLERLAMDRGLRVAFKREHPGASLLISWAIAPRPGRRGVAA